MADKNVDGVAISSTVLTAVGVIVAVLTLFSMLNLFRCLRRRKRLVRKAHLN